MARSGGYWSGLATGFVVGMAGAFFLPKLMACAEAMDERKPMRDGAWEPTEVREKTAFRSRRENPESAADPTDVVGEFHRMGGAPGPGREPEQMQVPGRHGELVDLDQPVQLSPRAIEVKGGF